jgi:hypothetical protein
LTPDLEFRLRCVECSFRDEVTVDVQGIDPEEAALAAAADLAAQQAACLMAEGPCAAVSVPALRAPSETTPAA